MINAKLFQLRIKLTAIPTTITNMPKTQIMNNPTRILNNGFNPDHQVKVMSKSPLRQKSAIKIIENEITIFRKVSIIPMKLILNIFSSNGVLLQNHF